MIEFRIIVRCPTCGDIPDEEGDFKTTFEIHGPEVYAHWVLASALRELAEQLESEPGVQ